MKVSYKWLQEYIIEPLPPIEQLVEALTMHSFEIESVDEIRDDKILDVKVLPNRTHDCLSHYGVASEIAGVFGFSRAWLLPNQPLPKGNKLKLSVNTRLCDRAVMVYIEGIKIGESPKWLKEKLKVIDHRSINTVVDITNYLTFAYGQPMHAFDADKLSKNRKGYIEINIRDAKQGEEITLLDGKKYTLDSSMMIISDKEKALDVAGVMGGLDSSVEKDTKNIVLSLSGFDAVSIRKTSKSLGLRTDASQRFENDISPSLIDRALPFALKLISELAGGVVVDGVDLYPQSYSLTQKQTTISVTAEKISKILGVNIDKHTIIALLGRQQIKAEKKDDEIVVTVPLERLDLNISEDIAEEVGRLYGYEKIFPISLLGEQKVEIDSDNYFSNFVRNLLVKQGFSEIYTYTFQDTGEVEIENPLAGDKKYLRNNLSSGMEKSLNHNSKYLDLLGIAEVKLFEIGKVFNNKGEHLHLSMGIKYPKDKNGSDSDEEIAKTIHIIEKTFDVSIGDVSIVGGVVEIDLSKIIKETKLQIDSEKIPKIENKNILYKSISPYPFAVRDLAVFVPTGTGVEKVKDLIKKHFSNIVVRFSLFDTFAKDDKISYAFRLVFQSSEKTLTDKEINIIMDKIYETLKSQEGFEIR